MAAFTASLALLAPCYESAASQHVAPGGVEPHVPVHSVVRCGRHRSSVGRRRDLSVTASRSPHGGPSPSRSWPQGGRHGDAGGPGAAAGGSSATVGAAMGAQLEQPLWALALLRHLAGRLSSWVDWRQFGRHQQYGNGTPRTLARGWVHVAALLALEACLWACAANLGGPFQPLPPRAASLARWTATAFYGSVVFHLVPWHTVPAYNVALCVDFMAIMAGFTGQVAVWVGITSVPGLISLAMSLSQLGLCISGLAQQEQPLWAFQRIARRNLVLGQFALLSLVEAVVIPNKALVAAIVVTKWVGFTWYVTFGRHDAERSSGLTYRSIWGDHDNFHVIAIGVAALQICASIAMG